VTGAGLEQAFIALTEHGPIALGELWE